MAKYMLINLLTGEGKTCCKRGVVLQKNSSNSMYRTRDKKEVLMNILKKTILVFKFLQYIMGKVSRGNLTPEYNESNKRKRKQRVIYVTILFKRILDRG